jgi:hypothetical protein
MEKESDNTAEKQLPGKLLFAIRVLKWVFVALLVILLVLGLIFRAPLKVIALLAVILLACTVLPKAARKWFWAGVGIVILVLIIWVFLPDGDGQWRPYTFDQELAALEAKYVIPDEENAARVYNILLEEYDSNAIHPDFLDLELDRLTMSEPWASGDIEKCRFAISPFELDLSKSMLHSAAMRNWARRLLARGANNDLAENRIDQAIEKNLAVLEMGKHLCQQSTMIDLLCGIAVEALAVGQFKKLSVTGDVTEEQLMIIDKALASIKHDWSLDLPGILEHEKLLDKNLWAVVYEVNPKGKTRFARDATARIKAEFPEEMPPLTYWQKKLHKASVILAWFVMPPTPQKAAETIDAAYENLYAMADPNFKWQKEPAEFSITSVKFDYRFPAKHMAGLLEPTYYRLHKIYLVAAADRIGSQLMIALRRYKNKTGRWPQSLDEVKPFAPAETFIDPANNSSFVYRLTDDSFILYSKGKNNIDEEGKRDRWPYEKNGADDWLIWPAGSSQKEDDKADRE